MLHESSGRHIFKYLTIARQVSYRTSQVTDFFVRLKDQVKEAITRADREPKRSPTKQNRPCTITTTFIKALNVLFPSLGITSWYFLFANSDEDFIR